MSEYNAHILRFVNYAPSSILCLALEDAGTSKEHRLAVARENGNIEVWHVPSWTVLFVIPKYEDKLFEKVIWCKNRLFSFGLGGDLVEWDLTTLSPKHVVDSLGGAVWGAAVSYSKRILAVGCDDGAPRLFNLAHGSLEYLRALTKQESRVMCLAWSPEDLILAVGCSNSSICLYNAQTGRITTRMTCDVRNKVEVIVWDVFITQDLMLISTNSYGQTQFWDVNTGTLCQSFNSHCADVLTLCVDKQQHSVFTAGVDSKVVHFTRGQNISGYMEWKQCKKLMASQYDIKSLVMTSGPKEELISGGTEPRLIKYTLQDKVLHAFSCLPFTAHKPHCVLAKGAKLLLSYNTCTVHIWKIPTNCDLDKKTTCSPCKLLEVKMKKSSPIVTASISDTGKFIAVATPNEILLYCLSLPEHGHMTNSIRLKKVSQESIAQIQCMTFSEHNLVIATLKGIQMYAISAKKDTLMSPVFNHSFDTPLPCSFLCCSSDGMYCAIANVNKRITVYSLTGTNQVLKVPVHPCHITAVSFQPVSNILIWTCAMKHLHAYSVKKECLIKWCVEANGLGILTNLLKHETCFSHITYSPKNSNEVFLLGHGGVVKVDLSKTLPLEASARTTMIRYMRKKRTNANKFFINENGEVIAKVALHNDGVNILYFEFASDSSLILVEKRLQDFYQNLPPPLQVKRYGF